MVGITVHKQDVTDARLTLIGLGAALRIQYGVIHNEDMNIAIDALERIELKITDKLRSHR